MNRNPGSMSLKSALCFSFVIFTFHPASARATQTFQIDPKRSQVEFTVHRGEHIGARGKFTGLRGTVLYDQKNLAGSSVTASIPLNTINTAVNVRDEDLIGPKYFDCARFPKARFVSNSFKKSGSGTYHLKGMFSLHGVKKAVVVKIKGLPYVSTKAGKKTFKAVGTTSVCQDDYGLSLLKLHPDGAVRINKTIDIKVTILATRKSK